MFLLHVISEWILALKIHVTEIELQITIYLPKSKIQNTITFYVVYSSLWL